MNDIHEHGEELLRRACVDPGIADTLLIVATALAAGKRDAVDALTQMRPGSAEWSAQLQRLAGPVDLGPVDFPEQPC